MVIPWSLERIGQTCYTSGCRLCSWIFQTESRKSASFPPFVINVADIEDSFNIDASDMGLDCKFGKKISTNIGACKAQYEELHHPRV
jgi:hypothetical protein